MKNWFIIIAFVLSFSCNTKKANEHLAPNEYYTCSMDPQVREKHPGPCPICKMKMTKVTVDESKKGQVRFSKAQMNLANIVVETVRIKEISEEISLSAKIDLNQNENTAISSRMAGRIERLNFKNTGVLVKKGDVLFEIYSEQLSGVQRDYLLATQRSKNIKDAGVDYNALADGAKNKLLLLGMSDTQLDQIKETGRIFEVTPITAKTGGVVTDVKIREGDYVDEGETVLELNNMNAVWVTGQLYAGETATVKEGDWVMVKVLAYPDKEFATQVSYLQPELSANSKILPLRTELENTGFLFKPGMAANIFIRSKAKKAFALPLDAVLQFSNYKTVWVQNPDGSFETRMVETGISNSKVIEIVSGLKEGETVVISGVYLIQSDYQFKQGVNPMEGMKM